jgi:tRNA A37 methylthiotransferase MiaB
LKKLHVQSTAQGCLTNLQETTNVRKSVLAGGIYAGSESAEDADVIVVNTCGYNDTAEAASVGTIEALKAKYPGKQIIVGGCLPKINPERMKQVHSVDQTLSAGEWDRLPALLGTPDTEIEPNAYEATALSRMDLETRLSANRFGDRVSSLFFAFERLIGREFQPVHNILNSLAFDSKTYVVSVGTGCLGHCTYCAIKNAKGRLVSRPLEAIVADVRKGLAEGFRRFHLVGDDIGCWGQDQGTHSAVLLKEILRIRDTFEVIVNYFDPTWLVRHYDDLIEPFSDPRIVCVNFPLQSGSTSLARKMARHYDVEKVLEELAFIKSVNPTMVMKTHLMVGFPGESEEDLAKTLEVVRHFDLIFPNRFAPRIGTPAARKSNHLTEREKDRRFRKLKTRILARHARVAFAALTRARPPVLRLGAAGSAS